MLQVSIGITTMMVRLHMKSRDIARILKSCRDDI